MVFYYIPRVSFFLTAGRGSRYDYDAAGNDIGFCRYASASGRDGNERDIVPGHLPPNLREGFCAASYGGQPWDQLLYAAYY